MKYLFLLIALAAAYSTRSQPSAAPKLVVGIVVDQMRFDYLYKYYSKYRNDGFKRLLREGYNCRNTHYNYAPTYTGPGHASIYTGTTPSVHGITGNNWFDKGEGKVVYCSGDETAETIGTTGNAGKMSAKRMMSSTVTDELKLSNQNSKVIGIALKDRGGILPAGHAADAAYWYDENSNKWISSSYYLKELPPWVVDFNNLKKAEQYSNVGWPLYLNQINNYSESGPDSSLFEETNLDGRTTFPHRFTPAKIKSTPFGNSLTTDFAIECLKKENMGKGNQTDFLAISYSSTDYIGHSYGPQSVEVQDCYLRLDSSLGALINFLDSWVGKKNVLIFLTADHAAAQVPRYLKESKIPASNFEEKKFKNYLQEITQRIYGDSLILSIENQHVVLNEKKIAGLYNGTADFYELTKAIAERLCPYVLNYPGINRAWSRQQLLYSDLSDPLFEAAKLGFYNNRSGHIAYSMEPAWIEHGPKGTTHGSAYDYDTHVPLLFYGGRIKKGELYKLVSITDIAPTVSQLLNISNPNACTGKPIQEVLK